MAKSNYFSGKSVFGQLISLIEDKTIKEEVKRCDSDRYVKRFMSRDHLISMLFCSFAKCNSLREVSGAMLGLSGKTAHFKLTISQKGALFLMQIKPERLNFLKIYTIDYWSSMAALYRTAELKRF